MSKLNLSKSNVLKQTLGRKAAFGAAFLSGVVSVACVCKADGQGLLSGVATTSPFASVAAPVCDQTDGIGCDLGSGAGGGRCDAMGCDAMGCDAMGGGIGVRDGCDTGLLGLGLIKRSEGGFDDFISPMTNPLYFEDPRQLTEVRGIFINQKLPYFNAINTAGGRAQVYAAQIRVRLTENLSLIAVKDGYVVSQSPIVDDGWGDLGAGLKYSLYRDGSAGRMVSIGGRFEAPTGEGRALQGNGDGVFDFFLSGGSRIGASAHWLSGSGFVFPADSSAENQMWYWSNHLDKRLGESRVYAFTELNWFHYLKSGTAFPLPIEGGDYFNLGSTGVAGHNIVTNAYGLKYKPGRNLETGVAWEFPLTDRRGVMDNRLTADLIWRY